MNVKIDKFYVNGQTSSNSNLNSRWNFVIKVGCFEISFMCRSASFSRFTDLCGKKSKNKKRSHIGAPGPHVATFFFF